MEDLAGELGMSKKTLYAHFPSKTALLEAVIHDKFAGVEIDFDQITSSKSSDFPTTLQRLLECVQRHTGEIQPSFIRDVRREAPEIFKLVETLRRERIQRHFGKLLNQGRRAGLIRKDIPVNLIIEILLGAVQAIMNPPKMEEMGLTPKTGFLSIIKVVFEGAIAEKRRTNL